MSQWNVVNAEGWRANHRSNALGWGKECSWSNCVFLGLGTFFSFLRGHTQRSII